MSTNFVTTDTFGTVSITAGNSAVVIAGVNVISSAGIGISGAQNTGATVHGGVYAFNIGVSLGSTSVAGDSTELLVGATGIVQSAVGNAVFVDSDTNYITNHGQIATSSSNSGVDGIAASFQLILQNTGSISALQGIGVDINGTSSGGLSLVHTINNTGFISGSDAIEAAHNTVEATNSGQIMGINKGIDVDTSGQLNLVNSGLISGATASIETTSRNDQVTNAETGILSGHVDLSSGDNTLSNHGQIFGDVVTTSGRDIITNSGQIDGDVSLGSGVDLFRGNGGIVTGTISGEAGNDTIYADQDDVVVDGGADDDLLIARGDVLNTVSVETIRLRGDDDISAAGDDLTANDINGNVGNNALSGGGGKDTLRGGAGDDELTGGQDKDILIGGSGADVFIYGAADESTVADSDRIRSFDGDEDVIDLSSSAFNDLLFIKDTLFSGSQAELRVTSTASGTLRVEADIDADGVADMRIVVTGAASLGQDDFLL